MAIPKGHRTNFNTMLEAAKNSDLALMECQDKKTKKKVFVVCMVGRDNGEYVFTPVAKIFDGNPYKEVTPPEQKGPQGLVKPPEASC